MYPDAQRPKSAELWPGRLYSRSFSYNINYSDSVYKIVENTTPDRSVFRVKANSESSGIGRLSKKNDFLNKTTKAAQIKYKYKAHMNDTKFKGL